MNALLSEDHALTLVEQRFNKVILAIKVFHWRIG